MGSPHSGPGGIPTHRPALTFLAVLLLASAALASALPGAPPAQGILKTKPIGQMILEQRQHFAAEHADHPMSLPLPPVDAVGEARRVLKETPFLGRTPLAWADVGDPERLLALRPSAPGGQDLVAQTLRVAALAGAPVAPADVPSLRAQADALPADVRAAFADLVAAVADAYETQAPVAAALRAAIDPRAATAPSLTQAQRDVMILAAESIVAHGNHLRDVLAASAPLPTFSDPEGLVVLGSSGADTYTRAGRILDPVVLVDPAGNDLHLTSAGGACPFPSTLRMGFTCNGLAVSVVMDMAGDDAYVYDGLPAFVQGSGGFGAIGILGDHEGNDQYVSTMTRHLDGPFFSYVDGAAQGAGEAGYGLLLEGDGHDTYRADVRSARGIEVWDFAQGFGSLGGLGIAADRSGDDRWLSNGLGLVGSGFQGVYTNGVGFYGGVGVLRDVAGDDRYHATNYAETTDYYAQGFGGIGGLGIFYEESGDDDYSATQEATDPFIVPLLNCAFGTGSLGGLGVFIEVSGNDVYFGDSISPYAAETMNEGMGDILAGYGLFVDVRGDDGHFMEANGGPGSATAGRGVLFQGGANKNVAGTYLDLEGDDVYTGAPPSRDNARWTAGADVNNAALALAFLPEA